VTAPRGPPPEHLLQRRDAAHAMALAAGAVVCPAAAVSSAQAQKVFAPRKCQKGDPAAAAAAEALDAAFPPGRRRPPSSPHNNGGAEEWGCGDSEVEIPRAKAEMVQATSAAKRLRVAASRAGKLRKGMIVEFDKGRRGWVDTLDGGMDEFWVCDESTRELVCNSDKLEHGVRSFGAAELSPTGEWSRDFDYDDNAEEMSVPSYLVEVLSADICASSLDVPAQVDHGIYDGDQGTLVVGPGYPPSVKASMNMLREHINDLVRSEAQPKSVSSSAVPSRSRSPPPPSQPSPSQALAFTISEKWDVDAPVSAAAAREEEEGDGSGGWWHGAGGDDERPFAAAKEEATGEEEWPAPNGEQVRRLDPGCAMTRRRGGIFRPGGRGAAHATGTEERSMSVGEGEWWPIPSSQQVAATAAWWDGGGDVGGGSSRSFTATDGSASYSANTSSGGFAASSSLHGRAAWWDGWSPTVEPGEALPMSTAAGSNGCMDAFVSEANPAAAGVGAGGYTGAAAGGDAAAEAMTTGEPVYMPSGWEQRTSRITGRTYYWHEETCKTQFEPPTL